MPGCEGAGTAERSYPASEVRGLAPEARADGREEQPKEQWLHRHRRA